MKNSLPAIFIPCHPVFGFHNDIWSEVIHCEFSFWNFSIDFVERVTAKNMIWISVLKIRSIQILNWVGRKSPILLIIRPTRSSMWFKTDSRSFPNVFTRPISCCVTNVFTINILSKYMNGAWTIFFDRINSDFETSESWCGEFCFLIFIRSKRGSSRDDIFTLLCSYRMAQPRSSSPFHSRPFNLDFHYFFRTLRFMGHKLWP